MANGCAFCAGNGSLHSCCFPLACTASIRRSVPCSQFWLRLSAHPLGRMRRCHSTNIDGDLPACTCLLLRSASGGRWDSGAVLGDMQMQSAPRPFLLWFPDLHELRPTLEPFLLPLTMAKWISSAPQLTTLVCNSLPCPTVSGAFACLLSSSTRCSSTHQAVHIHDHIPHTKHHPSQRDPRHKK